MAPSRKRPAARGRPAAGARHAAKSVGAAAASPFDVKEKKEKRKKRSSTEAKEPPASDGTDVGARLEALKSKLQAVAGSGAKGGDAQAASSQAARPASASKDSPVIADDPTLEELRKLREELGSMLGEDRSSKKGPNLAEVLRERAEVWDRTRRQRG